MRNLRVPLVLATLIAASQWALAQPATTQPDSIDLTMGHAAKAAEDKEYAHALALYSQVLTAAPDNFDALYASGWIENEKEQFAAALIPLTKASLLRPDESKVFIEIGFANARLRKADEAIAAFTQATRLNDYSYHAWEGLGDAYYDLKQDYSGALKAYLRADYQRSDEAVVNYRIGMCYEKAQNFGRAEMFFRRVADRVVGYLPAQTELGFCYLNLKEYDSARDRYERALKIDPKNIQAHYFHGKALLALKEYAKARLEANELDALAPQLGTKLRKDIDSSAMSAPQVLNP